MFFDHLRAGIVRFVVILTLVAGMFGTTPVQSAYAATLVVTDPADSGPGTLRQAILDATAGSSITFDPTLSEVGYIFLNSALTIDKNLTIDGSGLNPPLELHAFNTRIIEIQYPAKLTISGLTLSGGTATSGNGGAIHSMGEFTAINSTFLNNSAAQDGGAIWGGSIKVINSAFDRNQAAGDGGAIKGVLLDIRNSTFYQNQAGYEGGAIAIWGDGSTTIVNSTVFRNLAGDSGGGFVASDYSSVNLINNTFAENTAVNGDEFLLGVTYQVAFTNTIFVCNEASDECYVPSGNTIVNTNTILGIGTLQDYGLSEPADNGGPTETMALLPDSPLIDAGNDAACAAAPVNNLDQRGVARPQKSHCDIGAYEDQPLVRYVKQGATGANNGTSWANAHTDLQSALAAAAPDEEIWVAAGTYKPTSTTNRGLTFSLKNGVAIYGGFVGTEALITQRNYETNVTVLSGDLGVQGNTTDNSYHVVNSSDTNTSAILDGFTIRAGNANGSMSPQQDSEGGGLYNHAGSPTIRNVIFTGNYAHFGGGLHSLGVNEWTTSKPILQNVSFIDNSAIEGGGMRNWEYSHAILKDVIFSGNSVTRAGGGLLNGNYSNPDMMNVTFSSNTAGVLGGGGGMVNWNHSNPILKNVTFSGNTANWGGGIANDSSNPSLTDVTFENNSVTVYGGGMANDNSSAPILTNVTFSGNTAVDADLDTYGGGMANQQSSPLLTNVTFYNNTATHGGAMINRDAGSSPTLKHVTMSGNTATVEGGAIANGGNPFITNSIIWGNTGGEIFNVTGTPLVTNSIVKGGYPGTGNLDQDPLLGPLQNHGGFTDTMALSPGSPAIDAANDLNCPDVDQRRVPRPQGSHCDMGAYEALPGLVVTKAADTDDGACDSDCSLREAIKAAASGMTITFAENYTITLTSQLPAIDKVLNISGKGTVNTIIQASTCNPVTLPNGCAPAGYRIFEVITGGDLTISDLTLRHGRVTLGAGGGAVLNNEGTLTVLNSLISGSTANSGGAIQSYRGTLTVTNTTFTGNQADGADGGAISTTEDTTTITASTFTGNSATSQGGAIDAFKSTVEITDSTFSGNSAHFDGGGGIYNSVGTMNVSNSTFASGSAEFIGGAGIKNSGGHLNVVNSTFYDNHTIQGSGGAIDNDSDGILTVTHSTFYWNRASFMLAGAISNDPAGSHATIVNSILYGDVGGEVSSSAVVSHSIVQGGFPGTGNLDVNPLLGPLQNNGGPTQTMALDADSPAIDAADGAACPETDQRGVARPQGSQCDIGAYEFKDSSVRVIVGTSDLGSYSLGPNESQRKSFPGINNGPVKMMNADNFPIMAAERVIYKVHNIATSFSEMMGLPDDQLDTIYWLPWYNNVDLDTQLRFGNVSGSTATVHVYIAGQEMTGSPFTLLAGESTRKSFAGVNNGPVKVVSNVKIVAAERVIYRVNNTATSFSEVMALPNSQLDTTYWLPWYNNVDLDSQLRFANVSDSTATVHIYIAGQEMTGSPFTLLAGQSTRKSFAGVNNGPVKIVSDVKIVAAERVIYRVKNKATSFSEMMALPDKQLNTMFLLPWYNNVDLDTQLRITNTGTEQATVTVYIAGQPMESGPFTLAPGASVRKSYPGINNGPVKVISNINLVVSERVIYKVQGIPTSFSELMGLPGSLLDATFWFPWYNNVDLDTQLRFGLP